tara:strand:- start:60981 stop:63149 length:2169 start_codon:yes stop_codon:yes gene_type:complete
MTQKKKPFQIIETITRTAFTYPRIVAAISTLVLLLSFSVFKSIKVELDLYNSHNSDFPSLTRLWNMMDEFQDFSNLSVLVEWHEEPSSEKVCTFLKTVKKLESTIDGTKSTFHLFKLRHVESQPRHFWYPLSLPDPCEQTGQTLASLKKDLDPNHPFYRMSPTNKQMLLQIKLHPDFDLRAVGHWINDLKSSDYSISAVGPSVFQYYVNEILKKDSVLHILTIIFFLLFFKVFFGTWRTGMYFLFTVVATLSCLAGFMSLFGLPIDILTNSLFLVTAIAGTADYIFICWGMSRGFTLKDSALRYCRAGFFTTLTTIVGFFSLCISDLHTIQRFGLAAAIGALLEWFFTFMALPAFLKTLKLDSEFVSTKSNDDIFKKVQTLNHWTPSRWLTIGFSLFVFAGPFLFFHLKFEENPSNNFPESHPVKQSLQKFNSSLGWQNTVFIQLPASTPEKAISECLNEVAKSPAVHSIDNPIAIENYFLKGLEPLRRDSVKWELTEFGLLKSYITRDSIRAIAFLKSNSPSDISDLHAITKKSCPDETHVVGQSDVYREASEVLSRTLSESFLVSLIIVIFIIFYLQRKLGNKHYFVLPLSLLGGPLFLISGMSILNISISPFNSMFLAILVGITGDNAIQYLFVNDAGNLDEGVEENGPASIIIGIITVISSLFFLFQTLIPMKILGLLFSAGFLINLFGDLWILKGLLKIKDYLTKRSTAPSTVAPGE